MKATILALLGTYIPGFLAGGPIRSVHSLVDAFGAEFDWRIICPDRDLGSDAPYPGIVADRWTPVGKALVFYASPRMLRPWNLLRLLRGLDHDLLYLNSFFSPRMSILPVAAAYTGVLRRSRILIAPRGEFSPGALAIKAWKKRPYLWMARCLRLYRNCRWHLSTSLELDDLRSVFPVSVGLGFDARNCFVAPDMVDFTLDGAVANRALEAPPNLSVAFLSRISPMKNLDFALRALAQVRARVVFSVYGPEEDAGYVNHCRELAGGQPANVEVRWCGPVAAAEVVQVLSAHDLMLLPTRGENFGHVIVEAWAAGLPVLISDQTPWRGLAQEGIGWDLPLDSPDRFAAVVDEVAAWPREKRLSAAKACRKKADLVRSDDRVRQENLKMFETVLAVPVRD